MRPLFPLFSFFFFNDTATTEIYTLSLHDALPIYSSVVGSVGRRERLGASGRSDRAQSTMMADVGTRYAVNATRFRLYLVPTSAIMRSEEHTSELQSRPHLVCRLLLEKKKQNPEVI